MNEPDEHNLVVLDLEVPGRLAVLTRFKIEDIQHLGRDDLLAAKTLAGHGSEWGKWTTPESLMPGAKKCSLSIDIHKRLTDYLVNEKFEIRASDDLVEEGVLVITRIALLMKMVPMLGRTNTSRNGRHLKSSSIAYYLYQFLPKFVSYAISRKAANPAVDGLFKCLTETDLLTLKSSKIMHREIERIHTLVAYGVWSDEPPQPDIRCTDQVFT